MAFSSGTFSLVAGNPVTTGTTISSTWANTTLSDIATGLSTCVLKDGTQTITANIPMSSFKFTGLAAGSAAGDSVRYEQLFTTGTVGLMGNVSVTGTLFIGSTVSTSGAINMGQAAILTATSTVAIGAATGNYAVVTGAATVSGFDTIKAGALRIIEWAGVTPLAHSSSNILPGAANITTATGDVSIVVSEGGGTWRHVNYLAAAYPPKRPVLGTEQASTAGTAIDFTGIPSWATKIEIEFFGVSTTGTSAIIIQLGDSGGIENAGYLGSASGITNTVASTNYTDGFGLANATQAASVYHGVIRIVLEDASAFTWIAWGVTGQSDQAKTNTTGGSKSTSAALDRLRITTQGGTDTFDAGAINIIYE